MDEIVEVPVPDKQCPKCGGKLGNEEVQSQFVTDIPPVRPHTIQFNVHSKICECCHHRMQGRDPRQISNALGAASVQIGPNTVALAAHMNKTLGVSYEKMSFFYSTAFGLKVARSTLARALLRLGKKSEFLTREIASLVRQSSVVYPDETGWKVAGKRAWLWAFVSLLNQATLYVIHSNRSYEVAEQVLGEDYDGTLGRDGWKPYNRFKEACHQLCLAHIFERIRRNLKIATRGAVIFPRTLKTLLQDALDLRNRRDQEELSHHGLLVAVGRLKKRLEGLLKKNFSNNENRKLAAYVETHGATLFTFLIDPNVEATNWPAEQAIRPAVVNRKMSGGNREEQGAQAQSALMSVLRTCWQRGLDPIALFIELQRSVDPETFAKMTLGP